MLHFLTKITFQPCFVFLSKITLFPLFVDTYYILSKITWIKGEVLCKACKLNSWQNGAGWILSQVLDHRGWIFKLSIPFAFANPLFGPRCFWVSLPSKSWKNSTIGNRPLFPSQVSLDVLASEKLKGTQQQRNRPLFLRFPIHCLVWSETETESKW